MSRPRPARVVLDSAVSERQFQDAIVELATRLGWMWYHVPDSRRCPPGWPDLALWRPPQFLLVELKREGGRLSPVQRQTIEQLRECGLEVCIWRPAMWSEIEETLR